MNIWKGKKVRLRAIEPEDWLLCHAANDNTEVARYCDRVYLPFSKETVKKHFQDLSVTSDSLGLKGDFYWMIENLSGELVGMINTFECKSYNGTFKYGLAIYPHYQKHGYGTEAILLVLRYYFLELRYQKVNVLIYAFNDISIKLHQRLGFHQEGNLRRMIYTNGSYHDELIWGMTSEEFVQHHIKFHENHLHPSLHGH